MKLSQGEKLVLLALADMKDGRKELDLDFIRRAILSGNTWALTWKHGFLAEDDADRAVVEETADILAMWKYLEHSISKLSPEDREQLEKDAYPYSLGFEGFDGNNDPHISVAHFFIQDMDRFHEFKDRNMNSHSIASLTRYRRMLPVYQRLMRESSFHTRPLSAQELLSVLKPSHQD